MMATCEELLALPPGAPLSPAARTHLEGCPACRALWAAVPAPALAPAAPPALLREAVQQELAARPQARPWWGEALGLVGFHALVTVGCLLLVRARPDAAQVAGLWGTAALLTALGAAGTLVALAPRPGRLLPLLALGLGGVAALLVGTGSGPGPLLEGGLGGGCLVAQLGFSAPPLAAALVLLVRVAHAPWRALVAALGAGVVGLLVLHLHCPDGRPLHLFLTHVLPWLGLGLGAVVVRARLRSRSFAP